jgi:hypothetical protein
MTHLTCIFLSFLLCFVQYGELYAGKKSKPKLFNDSSISYEKSGCLFFNNPNDVGLGALVVGLLKGLEDYEAGEFAGLSVHFDSGCYLDPDLGPNWWEYFFEPIALGDTEAPLFCLTKSQNLKVLQAGYLMSREKKRELAKRYLVLKPALQEEIDTYVARYFDGHYIIGVHHRGTDKKIEAILIPYKRTLEVLAYKIKALPQEVKDNLRIYVATDDARFLEKISEIYPSKVIFNDFVRSTDGSPLHYSQNLYSSNYQKGREAILDCYLLSRCNLLIHPCSSTFSTLSTLLNSEVEVVSLK